MGNRFMPGVAHVFGRKPRRFQLGCLLIGTSQPVLLFPFTLAAAGFARAERMATGKYEFELADVWPTVTNPTLGVTVPAVYVGGANYGSSVENEDLQAQVGAGLSGTTGRIVLTVRLKAGTANADPVGGGGGSLAVWIELETAP